MKPSIASLGVLFVAATLVPTLSADVTKKANVASVLQESLIWSPSAPTGKQVYVVFRKTLQLDRVPASAALHLFADSRYILWINGKYVDRGPCRFNPIGPEYDTLDVIRFLQPGANVIAVVVHHCHDGNTEDKVGGVSGRIMRHAPGLTAILEISDSLGHQQVIHTDTSWRASKENRFGPSDFTASSIPDNMDARYDSGDWTAVAFDDSAWEKAAPIDGKQWGPLRARSIPLLRETEVQPLHLVQQQTGFANPQDLEDCPEIAKRLPIDLVPGSRVVIDAGHFVQVYSMIDVEANEGSQIELTYSQTFFSRGNKTDGSRWTGVSRYTTRPGRQTIVSGDTFGCKYMVIRCSSGKVRLLGVKLINRLYPFDVVGKFACDDPLLNDIWQLGVHTVQTCSEDAYVDCATRERTEWLADGVMVAYPISRLTMAGPGVDGKPYWSDPRLLGSMLRHTGQSLQPDGRVKARSPTDSWDIHAYIEDYSCLWIQNLRIWHDNTGDIELVREMWPAVNAQLKWFLDRRTERGLVKAREFVYFGNPLAYEVCEGTTLNAFVVRALQDAAELARLLGDSDRQHEYTEASQAIHKAINTHLWDEEAHSYHGAIKDGKKTRPTAHAAAIGLYFDIVPAEQRKEMENRLYNRIEKEDCLPYSYAFYLEDFVRMNSEEADQQALNLIRQRWLPMARFETKTTWESFSPGEDCHESGGAPTIYLSRHVLGVGVDGPVANHRLVIQPHLGDLMWANGVVVTEFGPVPISWRRPSTNGRPSFEVEIPTGVTARVFLPQPSEGIRLIVDGGDVTSFDESTGRWVTIELGEGKHVGKWHCW